MFLMDIAQSDDADSLLRELHMLKDDALEAADEAIQAPDPALADLCDALRWTAAHGNIQAITAVIGAWTPRGLLFTSTVTVATSPSDVKVIEHVPVSLAQGSPLLEYVSKDPAPYCRPGRAVESRACPHLRSPPPQSVWLRVRASLYEAQIGLGTRLISANPPPPVRLATAKPAPRAPC